MEKKNAQNDILNVNEFFGERAIRTKEARAATIKVTSNECILLEMHGNYFNDLLVPVIDLSKYIT